MMSLKVQMRSVTRIPALGSLHGPEGFQKREESSSQGPKAHTSISCELNLSNTQHGPSVPGG